MKIIIDRPIIQKEEINIEFPFYTSHCISNGNSFIFQKYPSSTRCDSFIVSRFGEIYADYEHNISLENNSRSYYFYEVLDKQTIEMVKYEIVEQIYISCINIREKKSPLIKFIKKLFHVELDNKQEH